MPLIIWGTKGVQDTLGGGQFFCPGCRDDRPYTHQKMSRYFTLFFIPLFPVSEVGRYIECDYCMGTYDEEVLELAARIQEDQDAVRSKYEEAVRRIMVGMMMVDGEMDDDEVTAIVELSDRLPGKAMTADEVRDEAVMAEADDRTVEEFAAAVAPGINDHGKDLLFRAALAVAAADGVFEDSEKDLLMRIAASLEMSGDQVRAILEGE